LSDKVDCDETKGELKLGGRRYILMSMDALCNHLDLLVGTKVAEVIMRKLELQEATEEAERFFQEHANAKVEDFINYLIKYDALSGVGLPSVNISSNPNAPITIEISNPYTKKTEGSMKSLLFSWWCGALSSALKRELDIWSTTYDATKDILKCTLVYRQKQ
jgi:hypothetical protein